MFTRHNKTVIVFNNGFMQKHQRNNTDGFIVRRRGQSDILPRPTLDSLGKNQGLPAHFLAPKKQEPHRAEAAGAPLVERRVMNDHSTAPIAQNTEPLTLDMSLNDTDKPTTDRKTKKQKAPRRPLPVKKIIKWAVIILLVSGIGLGAYFAYKLLATGGQIFNGNLVGAVFAPPKELKMDEYGRSNFLLFGTSEDDPEHGGADLTDSIMVASVDQKNKDVFLVSIPRDLYVNYGQACPAGYQGKINALYSCLKEQVDEAAGREALRKKVGEVLGLEVQYVAQVNYTALREVVDAVGGITVTIDSADPRGILDRNFDWDCPKGLYTCYNVKYPNGSAQLDGKHALYLARARGANGDTYGLAQANFDREKYQRAILVALKDKAVSAGTLANPVAVNGILDTLGRNVRTNFDTEEIKTLVKLAQEIQNNSIVSVPLNDAEGPLVTTGNVGGQSIVRPVKGIADFSQIQAVMKAHATGDVASLEKAVIDVLNASGEAGIATKKADDLRAQSLTVGNVANAPSSLNTAPLQVYDLTEGKMPGTRKKLESLFGVTVSTAKPEGVTTSADFVVIIGTNPSQ